MMLNRFKLSIRKKSPNAALANTYLLLLTLIIIINHHGTSSQSTQQRKPKSRVVVAAKDIPTTSFSCNEHSPGYYADVETGCQVYHMCSEGGTQFSYRCPNTTLFQQRMLICAHWYQVNCSRSEQHFNANLLIGQRDKPFIDESEQVNIYYHGKDLKNLLNPDDLQRLQQARQASSSSNGLQMSASEYPTPGAFNNFQRPRMENHFTDNFATQKSINEQNINHQQSGKPILQFPTSRTTLAPFQQHNQQNFNNQRSGKPVSQFPTSSTTFASFKQNNYNQNIQSLQPQQTVSTTAKANQFNQQRIVYTPSTTTAIPFQQNNFNQNFNSFQPQQIDTATVMPIQLNQQRISQKISTISTPVPFNIGTNPHTPSTQQSSFHTNNQHTVAHFTTQPQFHISTAPFTNQPQVSQNQMPQKFTSSPFQSTVNQHFQVENNLSNNNVGQVSSNSNFFPNTEKPATVVNEHTYNNFIRRFIPDVEESSKSASGGNRATNNINTTNEYNQFLKVFVPDTSPVQNVTTNSTDYNQFLKVFIPDDSTFTNTNNSYRQNSKLFTSNFVSEINSLSKDIEPPFVGLISDLSAPPFEDVDSDSVGSSLELFKLKIQDPRHAFFIPDNDNEQIPLDSQVTPITITIQRPGSSKPHPMTFLNSVSDNCYRCHPNFIVDKGACTPCVIIR